MASITIRNVDDDLKARLRVRAAHRRRSMEDEVLHVLRAALGHGPAESLSLAATIHERFRALTRVKLKPADRESIRKSPKGCS